MSLGLAVTGNQALAAGHLAEADRSEVRYRAGADSAGDAYYPRLGNGGYNVRRYRLHVGFDQAVDEITGVARIHARATQNLSRFNLDFTQLRVRSVEVDDRAARWRHRRGELTIDPAGPGLRRGDRFTVTVAYAGSPRTFTEPSFGQMGFFRTDDGALLAGEPLGASSWFPVNGHPRDKARYTVSLEVPAGLTAVSNGALARRADEGARTTWTWRVDKPMAPYLATFAVGDFQVDHYTAGGIEYWDAIDTSLFDPVAVPRTGTRFAITGADNSAYKRLTRTIDVPSGGAQFTFWASYRLEEPWDYLFVEARPVGTSTWTTLKDANGHTSRDTGFSCPDWLGEHPFLKHYQTPDGEGGCTSRGTTGLWWAASGDSKGWQQWRLDLDRYAGRAIQLSFSHATDGFNSASGAYVDDLAIVTGTDPAAPGSTSFENDGDTLDGWLPGGPPKGSPKPPKGPAPTWLTGTIDQAPDPDGLRARTAMAQQPEMLAFLEDHFGPYPFATSGGIVDDVPNMQFSLETQTRPVYPVTTVGDPGSAEIFIVHELSHQWFGDSLTVRQWRHIWLNEGFATYVEWLWDQEKHGYPARRAFRDLYKSIPADDPFWKVRIGDPGPDNLFHGAVYFRGGMTLQALRERIGARDFATLMRRWPRQHADGHVTTAQFIRAAERISGQQLDGLFRAWLFRPAKPRLPGVATRTSPRLAPDEGRGPTGRSLSHASR
jgi:hypothetical protein